MTTVWLSLAVLGGMAILFGVGLGYAGVKFKVEEDPRIGEIREVLPGANCGGCGFAGCDALAAAIVEGKAKANACPVGGGDCTIKISEIMGIKAELLERQASFIRCNGGTSKSLFHYHYEGLSNCMAAMQLAGGGSKACKYGCLGGGSCIAACKFGAISMVDGIAVIDNDKCTCCGMCVAACPKKIIQVVPHKSTVRVACNSCDKGKDVRQICMVGCIACKICVKTCTYGAISVEDNLARIDYSKCTMCGACVEKCPTKVIKINHD